MKKIKTIEAVAAVSTAINDFIKELEKNPALVSIANTSEI